MSRRPCALRETDLKRAVKAVRAAGMDITGIEIEPVTGKIKIVTGGGSDVEKVADLDTWMVKHAGRT
jgi:hypothetical protein